MNDLAVLAGIQFKFDTSIFIGSKRMGVHQTSENVEYLPKPFNKDIVEGFLPQAEIYPLKQLPLHRYMEKCEARVHASTLKAAETEELINIFMLK